MIIGYILSGNASNEAEFFDGTEPEGTLCRECKTCLNVEFVPKHLDISKSKKYDLSYTHDLQTIFSERMKDFLCDSLKCSDLFIPIATSWATHYYVRPNKVVPFDAIKRKTRFISPCSNCGGFKEIIGATPAFLKVTEPLGEWLFRSDLSFSSYESKHPLYFVGQNWMEKIKAQHFRGVNFKEVHLNDT